MAPYIMEEYIKACKAGKRDYQARMMKGQLPTLQVLDEILPPKGSYSEVPLGLVQIPIDQIVGTKSGGRSNAFAGNFMPILRENTEFAYKWATLSQSHINEGIRDPIKAYEYMLSLIHIYHDKQFTVSVQVNGQVVGNGTGHTKKAAEQAAAYQAIQEKKF